MLSRRRKEGRTLDQILMPEKERKRKKEKKKRTLMIFTHPSLFSFFFATYHSSDILDVVAEVLHWRGL
jgi:hypothetical protein